MRRIATAKKHSTISRMLKNRALTRGRFYDMILKLKGKKVGADSVTWDTIYGLGSYDYFSLTDDEISVDHEFDRTIYPKCDNNSLGYFSINHLIAHDKNELADIIKKNAHKDFFSVKLDFQWETEYFRKCGFPPDRFAITKHEILFSIKNILALKLLKRKHKSLVNFRAFYVL